MTNKALARLVWRRNPKGRAIRTLSREGDRYNTEALILRKGKNRYCILYGPALKERYDTADIKLAAVKTIAMLLVRNG